MQIHGQRWPALACSPPVMAATAMLLFVLPGVRGFYLQVTPTLSLPCHGIFPHSETSLFPFPFQVSLPCHGICSSVCDAPPRSRGAVRRGWASLRPAPGRGEAGGARADGGAGPHAGGGAASNSASTSATAGPEGSPFKRLLQVVVAAFRKRKVDVPEEAGLLYHNMELDAPIAGGHQTRCGRASSGAADGPTPR